jgi:dienelactone hydrolase
MYGHVARELALKGFVVISVNLFKTDIPNIEAYRELLESIHFQKIDMADAVVLINSAAVGEHTKLELDYC